MERYNFKIVESKWQSFWSENNSFKVKWSSPPFSRIIKFSEFEIREKKQIKLNLDKKEIKLLERFLEIKSIRAFNCIINILPLGDDWEVNGKISMTCNLQCIISLEDLKYKLCIPIKRCLSSIQNKKIDKFIKYEDINSDIDPLTESIDLGDIISEELYLAIPKYPKKKGVKLDQFFNSKEDTKLNPFQKLEKLKF